MGRVEAHAAGTVVSGQLVEMVLGMVPEQTWLFDIEVPNEWAKGETVDFPVETPMRVRREIVSNVLIALGMTK